MCTIQGKLNGCRRSVKQWVSKQGSRVEQHIHNKIQELHLIQMHDNPDLPDAEAPIKEELHALLEQEELKWKQRAKEN